MRANSLALRLFLWATGWTVVILIVTGIVLSSIYRHAVERAFDRRLDVYLRTLVADVASPGGRQRQVSAVDRRAAVRIAAVGLVLAGHAARYGKARSAFVALAVGLRTCRACRMPRGDAASAGYRQGYAQGPEDQRLRLVERNIDLGDDGRYLIASRRRRRRNR